MDVTSLIKRHEGFRARLYRDSRGFNTIGYGRNLDAEGVSEAEAAMMFDNDLSLMHEALDDYPWFNLLNEVRKAVVLDMAFNLGMGGLLKFRRMIVALKLQNFDNAANEMMDSRWAVQVGQRAVELASMMRTGEWPDA